MSDDTLSGGCLCGAVRIEARGAPLRVGVCHCSDCKRQGGSAFHVWAAWPEDRVTIVGETRSWSVGTIPRHFCPVCGARLFLVDPDDRGEIEICLGVMDDAGSLTPTYEVFAADRWPWLDPVAEARQYPRHRDRQEDPAG